MRKRNRRERSRSVLLASGGQDLPRWQGMKFRLRKKWLLVVLLALIVGVVSGCQTIGYYAQAIKGEGQILANRKSIDKLIADPKTPADLRKKLELVQQMR